MKNFFRFSLQASFVLLSIVSCTSDPASPNPPSVNLPDDAGWRVVWYWDKDKDETSDFSQYTFYFRNTGVFEAVSNTTTVTGTWRTTSDDGSQRLVLSIANTKPLSDLTDDWVIVESGDQSIKLKDDNTEHVEELFFERIQ